MKRFAVLGCLWTAAANIAAADAPFRFEVPVEVRDLYREIGGVVIECVVLTVNGVRIAAGTASELLDLSTNARQLSKTFTVDATLVDEQASLLLPEAATYECSLLLTHAGTAKIGLASVPNPVPPPPHAIWGSHSDPRFEAAPNTPFVPIVRGVLAGDTPPVPGALRIR